jgi:hypothetical protein
MRRHKNRFIFVPQIAAPKEASLDSPVKSPTFMERIFIFLENSIVLTVMSIVGGLAGLFIEGKLFLVLCIPISLGLHRSPALKGIGLRDKILGHGIVLLASAGLLWWVGIGVNRSREHIPTTREIGDYVLSSLKGQAVSQATTSVPSSQSKRPSQAVTPPKQNLTELQSSKGPLTLHQLFKEDFKGELGFGWVPGPVTAPDGQQTTVEARTLIDRTAGVKFVAFYLPNSLLSYSACVFLSNHTSDWGHLDFDMETQDNGEPIFSKDYKFSGRVFIYHEDLFTPEQIGDLHRIFKEKHLLLELRGQEYVQLEGAMRLIDKLHKVKQP